MSISVEAWLPFVNGSSTQAVGPDVVALVEPASDQPLAEVALAGRADIDVAVAAARSALASWRVSAPQERSRLLHAIADALEGAVEELAELEARNVGKPIAAARQEVGEAVSVLRFFAGAACAIQGAARPLDATVFGYSLKEPVGVCALIVPWNYPLLMATWKVAPALAAGCTTVLKPDPTTPLTALRLAELAAEAGLPAGVLNVVPADGPTVGAYLARHPGVDKVAFTGSTRTGKQVMVGAADDMKRLTLELGGKSPSLVFGTADLAEAVPSSAWSIFTSAGQSCEARSRLLVERSVHDEVLRGLCEATATIRVGDPLDEATQMGSLISKVHRERVHSFVAGGVEEGAEVMLGGEPAAGPGAFYPPTVLAGVKPASTIAQEEVFGPVVVVMPFDDEDEAVRIANDSRYGLFATVWTGRVEQAHRVAHALQAGSVGVNTPWTAFAGMPFGGVKQSGFGRELSVDALDAYLEDKGIIVSTATQPFNPYG